MPLLKMATSKTSPCGHCTTISFGHRTRCPAFSSSPVLGKNTHAQSCRSVYLHQCRSIVCFIDAKYLGMFQEISNSSRAFGVPHSVDFLRPEMALECANDFFRRRIGIIAVTRKRVRGEAALPGFWPQADAVLGKALPRKQLASIELTRGRDIAVWPSTRAGGTGWRDKIPCARSISASICVFGNGT